MKTTNQTGRVWPSRWLGLLLILLNFVLAQRTLALEPPPLRGGPLQPLDSWSFYDTTNWTDDFQGYPISFTNITSSLAGLANGGSSLVVDTNIPAWLSYEIYQTDVGATNIIVNGPGSITLWYSPSWATTNGGPGDWAQLIDVGEWSSDASYGYWGLSIDPSGSNILFLAQDGAGNNYSLFAPISWTTNFFHFIALTYSATNVSLYIDDTRATNDPGGLSIWPPPSALSGGVYFGSDTNGNYQAHGLFNTIQTYDYVLNSNDIAATYQEQLMLYEINPNNISYSALTSAPSNPSTNFNNLDVITGAGFLTNSVFAPNCSYSTNGVWITNFVATVMTNGTMSVTFAIDGGTNGALYDVFATSAFEIPIASATWVWMGQGPSCYTYTIAGISNPEAIFILGTPQDSNGADLTDAYQQLVSKTDPSVQDSDFDNLITGWEILLGLNPHISNINNQYQRVNYSYTAADWVNGVSGIKGTSSINMDSEGNVTQVSQ